MRARATTVPRDSPDIAKTIEGKPIVKRDASHSTLKPNFRDIRVLGSGRLFQTVVTVGDAWLPGQVVPHNMHGVS